MTRVPRVSRLEIEGEETGLFHREEAGFCFAGQAYGNCLTWGRRQKTKRA
jgi:hypothetical protein